jgi:hypothetical protein
VVCDLRVDFATLDKQWCTSTLARYARRGVTLSLACVVLVGDTKGNRARALIVAVDGETVRLRVLDGSLRAAGR